VQGIVDALTEAGAPAPRGVTILGAGATACSALAALPELGVTGADVVVRDPARAGGLLSVAERLGLTVRLRPFSGDDAATLGVAGALEAVPELLISTVPAGVADTFAARIQAAGHAPAVVLDVVYSPWPTRLAAAASAAGAMVVSGFAMLAHQAAAQVELMTGKSAPLEAMHAGGEAELARRAAAR
jgi:shikimate dehydrogenase